MNKIFLILSFLYTTSLIGQQDSLIVENVFNYDLNFGISKNHRYCSQQKTYNKSDVLLREINFIKDSASENVIISDYTYFFYDKSGDIVSEEKYVPNDKLIEATKYVYKNNVLIEKQKFIPTRNQLKKHEAINYKYKEGKLVNKTYRNERNKKYKSVDVSYPEKNQILFEETNRLSKSKMEKTIQKLDGEKVIESIRLAYDNNRLVSDSLKTYFSFKEDLLNEKVFYSNGELQKKISYDYYRPQRKLKSITITDNNNTPIEFQSVNIEKMIIDYQGLESVLNKDQ